MILVGMRGRWFVRGFGVGPPQSPSTESGPTRPDLPHLGGPTLASWRLGVRLDADSRLCATAGLPLQSVREGGLRMQGGGTKTMTARLAARLAVLVFGSLGLFGCSNVNSEGNFTKKIDKVRPGMTESQVREALGGPDRKGGGVVDASPRGGSGSVLVGAVPAGSRYEDWYYDRNGT